MNGTRYTVCVIVIYWCETESIDMTLMFFFVPTLSFSRYSISSPCWHTKHIKRTKIV